MTSAKVFLVLQRKRDETYEYFHYYSPPGRWTKNLQEAQRFYDFDTIIRYIIMYNADMELGTNKYKIIKVVETTVKTVEKDYTVA